MPRIAVIGGGLTGLAAAHRLQELAAAEGRTCDVTLFEASPRLGGLVGTIERDGYLIDTGADSFITNKPGAIGLCQRLGLEDQLQKTDPRYRGALVVRRGRPVPVPEGFQLLSPAALWPVLTSPILSPWGKLRLVCERFIPPRAASDDESLASFVRRRFGQEALDRLIQPLVGGIYTSDPETLSLAATLPRFVEMERRHGSLIRASRQRSKVASEDDSTSSGARYGLFVGLRRGMQQLVDAVAQRVAHSTTLRLASDVQSLRPAGSLERGYELSVDGEKIPFDGVIVTVPPRRAVPLLRELDAPLSASLEQIPAASSAIVITGHSLQDIRHPLETFGVVVPYTERRRVLAISCSSRKFPNRAPDGRMLLRTFVGGAMQQSLCDQDDASLVELVRDELRELLGVTGTPDFAHVARYPQAMPQYTVGHQVRVAQIEQLAGRWPRLQIAGNAYHGVGVPDAIASGESAAERLMVELARARHEVLPPPAPEKRT